MNTEVKQEVRAQEENSENWPASEEGLKKAKETLESLATRLKGGLDTLEEVSTREAFLEDQSGHLASRLEAFQGKYQEMEKVIQQSLDYIESELDGSSTSDQATLERNILQLSKIATGAEDGIFYVSEDINNLAGVTKPIKHELRAAPLESWGDKIAHGLSSAFLEVFGENPSSFIAAYSHRNANGERLDLSYNESRERLWLGPEPTKLTRAARSLRSGIISGVGGLAGLAAAGTDSRTLLQLASNLSDGADKAMVADPSLAEGIVAGLGEAIPAFIPGVGLVRIIKTPEMVARLGGAAVAAMTTAGIEAGKAYESSLSDGLTRDEALDIAGEAFIKTGLIEGAFTATGFIPFTKIIKSLPRVEVPDWSGLEPKPVKP